MAASHCHARALPRPTYPGLHLLPGGEVFFAPVGFRNYTESAGDCAGNEESAIFELTGTTTGTWSANLGANDRTKGMSVLLLSDSYPQAQVMTVGGGDSAASHTYRMINLSSPAPSWDDPLPLPMTGTAAEPTPRVHPNVVLLPDGTVFVCGGAAVNEPCWLYDPANGTWAEMDELTYQRRYHSVALLLPTAEVMATGGGGTAGQSVIEVFRPPYLFGGAQPQITAVNPDPIHHGATFTIQTPQAASIGKASLVRPMAVTHQTDSEQRVIPICFAYTGPDTLRAHAPSPYHPHGLAPRGWYMLFIMTHDGVPSVPKFVFLH